MKPVQPTAAQHNSAAIVFLNRRTDGTPTRVSVVLSDTGLVSPFGYKAQELFDGIYFGNFLPNDTLTVVVNPSGKSGVFDIIVVIASYHIPRYTLMKCLN